MAKRKRPDKYTTAIVNDRLRWRPGSSPLCQAPAKEFAVLEVLYPRLPVRIRESRELPPASGRTIPVEQGQVVSRDFIVFFLIQYPAPEGCSTLLPVIPKNFPSEVHIQSGKCQPIGVPPPFRFTGTSMVGPSLPTGRFHPYMQPHKLAAIACHGQSPPCSFCHGSPHPPTCILNKVCGCFKTQIFVALRCLSAPRALGQCTDLNIFAC